MTRPRSGRARPARRARAHPRRRTPALRRAPGGRTFPRPRFPAGDRLYQVAEQDGQWAGLLLWCAPAPHLKDRDAWIGWDPLTRAQRLKLIVNQARFLIPDAAQAKLCAQELGPRHAPAETLGAAARCALNAAQRYRLKDALRQVPDPRRKQGQRSPLAPVLTVIALGLLAGKKELAQIQRFGTRLAQPQRQALGFWPKKGTKYYPVPTYTVLRDVLIALDIEVLADVLTRWLQAQAGGLPASLALDGKTIREHLGLIFSLVEHEDGAPWP